jgi:transcription elongation factor GreA
VPPRHLRADTARLGLGAGACFRFSTHMAKYLTKYGMAALRQKLAALESKREEALRSAGEAAQNDPNAYHDNFEYEEGMRQQELFSRQMRSLWEVLAGATPAPAPADNERAAIGHYVVVQRGDHDAAEGYVLCGEGEGALFENACSATSPLGRSLLGMAKDEIKTVPLENRSFSVKVLGIRAATAEDFHVDQG